MTTYIPFAPSIQAPFQFQVTLDGEIYTIQCTWNLFGQRFYINIYDTSNNLIVCRPMVGSPPSYNLNLAAGYFQTTVLVFRTASGNFEVDPLPAPPLALIFPPAPPAIQVPTMINNGGVAQLVALGNYPTTDTGLAPGALWSDSLVIAIVPGAVPNPSAEPVYFYAITAAQLLSIGGANLPHSNPGTGSQQLWNNGGLVSVA